MRPTFICLGSLGWGGCCWIRNSIYLREDKAHGPNFVFSSIIQDRYSINYCFRFDKVSTSYRLFVTTSLDVAHNRDQNQICTLLIFY